MGILLVAKNEFLKSLKYKKKLILTVLIPVIAVIAALGINSLMKPSINIGVIDKGSGNEYSRFKEKAVSIKGLTIKKANEDSINTDMILAKYSAVIQLNKDESFQVICLDNKVKENIEQIIKSYFANGDLHGFEDTLSEMLIESMTVAQRGGGYILLTLIITCTLSACNLIKDQKEGTLKRVFVSPYKPIIYILGTFLYNLLNTIVQVIISVIIITILPIDIGIGALQLLFIGLTIAIIATSLSCLIVNLCKTELQASLIASVVSVIMSLLGGSFLPLDKMPTLLKYVSNATITKWLVIFIEKIQQGVVNTDAFAPIGIILGLSMLMLIVACKLGERKFA
ncbi:ABC transporter permease [Clostridium estertheticum]|uniref:ABC transporter permease n=1 Tax=Clostridium estertheticum TaxID=238834 RepID=A0A7Y3SZC8_9CLOT|nr:ABC transporter permease [Clostridium estertheticum]NNU78017.1 ABC transporter permease [Clostridium estertheticum]WBL49450.1 ABC transporter permease [Clostridium estertheticum]